jgi:predicted dehydrogenase
VPVDAAPAAYGKVKASLPGTFGVLFQYGVSTDVVATPVPTQRGIAVESLVSSAGAIRLGVIGAGAIARAAHLPNIAKLKSDIEIVAISSRKGVSAVAAAKRYGIATATTDYHEILNDESINAVLIATRHSTHAQLVLESLAAGKHVFVEKPMCLTTAEGDAIAQRARESGLVVQVGFNRRYAPMLGLLRVAVGRDGLRSLTCRVNVGSIADDWSNTPEEGGRLMGEGVHFFDLCNWFMGSEATEVHVGRLGPTDVTNPNSIVTLKYQDGSAAQVLYTTIGHPAAGKEYYEAAGNGRMAICDNFNTFRAFGSQVSATRAMRGDKGLAEEWRGFVAALRGHTHPIKRPDELAGLAATRIALQVLGVNSN